MGTDHMIEECTACRRLASEMHSIEGIPLCVGCAEKLEQIRPGDPILCDVCGGSFYGDARCAWIVHESGGTAFCDHCSSAVSKGGSA